MKQFDIAVVGGGINGVSVAAEAASRGLSTLLVHARDLASSASATPVTLAGTHLSHLSALDFFQLNAMLDELQVLQASAPHLFEALPVTNLQGEPIQERSQGLVERYFQGIKNKRFSRLCDSETCKKTQSFAIRIKPARLILAKAMQAHKYGGDIRSYTKLVGAKRNENEWQLTLEKQSGNTTVHESVASTLLVNCSGWWANELLEETLNISTRCQASEEHRTQFFFKNPGIDLQYCSDNDRVLKIKDSNEKSFYIYSVNSDLLAFGPRRCDQQGFDECIELLQHFIDSWNGARLPNTALPELTREHFVHQRKAKFALIDDPCASNNTPITTPLLDLDNPGSQAVMMNIFGADVPLHKKIARQCLDVLQDFHGKKANPEFAAEKLPGGDIDERFINQHEAKLKRDYKKLSPTLLARLAQNYGSVSYLILGQRQIEKELGREFGHELYEREVQHLIDSEWVTCADDILWRRSLLGIDFLESEKAHLDDWIQSYISAKSS